MHDLGNGLAGPCLAAILAISASGRAQPARVSAIVIQTGARSLPATNEAVRAQTERALARCEPAARAARPFDHITIFLRVDARGRVGGARVELPAVYPAPDGTMHAITRAEQQLSLRFARCATRAIRTVRFPPGPADEIAVRATWAEPGPPTGVLGMLRP